MKQELFVKLALSFLALVQVATLMWVSMLKGQLVHIQTLKPPNANRTVRTPQQRQAASEKKKAWWDEKKRQGKPDAPLEVTNV